ncbi:16275_t:CDS:2, partial [Acaulospora morrowiae]
VTWPSGLRRCVQVAVSAMGRFIGLSFVTPGPKGSLNLVVHCEVVICGTSRLMFLAQRTIIVM